MKAILAIRMCSAFLLAALLLAALGPGAHPSLAAPAVYGYSRTDEFNSSYFHPLWSWVREDATHWSLDDAPGSLRITTQAGGVYGAGGTQKNILVADAPAGDFQITTKATINPTQDFQYAGIQVYQDDDNYVQLNWAFVGSGTTINFDKEINALTTNTSIAAPSAATLYLRIVRLGDVYTGYYSLDGSAWTQVGQHSASLANPKIGLAAANNLEGVGEIPADFDWFKLEANFAGLLYSESDTFDSSTLDSRWSWMNENAAAWSLTAFPGFMRILTDNQGVGAQNLLNQPVPHGDFALHTSVNFTPTSNFQIASLVIYQDADDMMQLGRAFCGFGPPGCTNGNGIYFDFVNAGTFLGNFATSVPETAEAHFIIERVGQTYSAFYSGDGLSWQLIGRHKPASAFVPSIYGLTAAQDQSDLQAPADFDYFVEYYNANLFMPLVIRQ